MLLVADVGNTNIVFGLYDGDKLLSSWRISSDRRRTPCELAAWMKVLFELEGVSTEGVEGAVLSSVVPPLTPVVVKAVKMLFGINTLVVGPGVKTGMPVLVDNPREVGTDRIVNAVAGYHKYGGPLIIVDFGTATTFDVVSARGEYLGGAIAPGIGISMEALFKETAQLPRIDFSAPRSVVGKNTVDSMRAGVFYGYLSLVEGMIDRIEAEVGPSTVVATGGFAESIASQTDSIDAVEPWLTLEGLRLIYLKNTGGR